MSRKSIQELISEANTVLADNTSGNISAADVRNMFVDFLNAIQPAYGYLHKDTPSSQVVGTVPVVMQWQTRLDSDPTQTTSSAALGTIQRVERGTSTIQFTADFEAPNGRFVSFTLYKDGVPTVWRITGNGGGTGNPIGVAISAIDYADPAATYSIQITAETNGTSVTSYNAAFLCSVDPVNSYT